MAKVGATMTTGNTNPEPKKDVTPKVVATPEAPKTDITPDADQQAPEAPKKEVKMPEPKAWQRVDVSDPNKPRLINQITFLAEKRDYEPGMRAEYDWHNLDNSDGLKRVVTAKYPKGDQPDETYEVDFMGYTVTIDKYGNSAVCKMSDKDGQLILEYVSLATVLDVLQDLVNPKAEDGTGTCNIPWGTIDQVIKKKRNLKSRIKNLGENDLPARAQRAKKEEAIAAVAASGEANQDATAETK